MKTIVQVRDKIGYVDGYISMQFAYAVVVLPNLKTAISVPLEELQILDIDSQKKYNKMFFS